MPFGFNHTLTINYLHANHHAAVVELIERRPFEEHEREISRLVEQLNNRISLVSTSRLRNIDQLSQFLVHLNLNLEQIAKVLETATSNAA